MTNKWWKNAVIYEIYIRSFQDSDGDGIGDLNGIRSRLPYLKKLGADAIWISPFFVSPCVDNGYDISDYYSVDPVYGTMEDFDFLVSEAHSLGIKVILDMVLNHTSDKHPWFMESKSSVSNPKRDYYIWRKEINNWGAQFGGSAWNYDEESGQYYLGIFCPGQPDLNMENPIVRTELKKMMSFWAGRGADGFRLDSISHIAKPEVIKDGECKRGEYSDFHDDCANLPKVHEYIKEFYRDVFGPHKLFTIGEASASTTDDALKYCLPSRKELSCILWFEHMALDGSEVYKWNDKKIDPDKLIRVLLKWQEGTAGKVTNTLYWCNHDQPRIVSKLCDNPELRPRSAKMLAALLYFMPGTMLLYQGQEIGMEGGNFEKGEDFRDIESVNGYSRLVSEGISAEEAVRIVGNKSRDNARTPMQWNGEKGCGFTTGIPWIKEGKNYGKINVSIQLGKEDSVLEFYRSVINLRKKEKCFRCGGFTTVNSPHGVFRYIRSYGRRNILVMCNLTGNPVNYPATDETGHEGKTILSNVSAYSQENGTLLPYECRVIQLNGKPEN